MSIPTILSTADLEGPGKINAPAHRTIPGTRAKGVAFQYTPAESKLLSDFSRDPILMLRHYGLGAVPATDSDLAANVVGLLSKSQGIQMIVDEERNKPDSSTLVARLAVGVAIWVCCQKASRRPYNVLIQGVNTVGQDNPIYVAVREHLARLPYALRPASLALTPDMARFEHAGTLKISSYRSSPPVGFKHDLVLCLDADIVSPESLQRNLNNLLPTMSVGGSLWIHCADANKLSPNLHLPNEPLALN